MSALATTTTDPTDPRPGIAARPVPSRPVAGLLELVRLIVRRDRVRMMLWFAGIVGLVVVSTASIVGLYDTPASLQRYARLVRDNAALIVQSGPGYGLDNPTTGAVTMNEVGIWTIVGVALMSVFMVVRHTRAEEESERAELVRAAPVGRYAQLAAALVGVMIANVLVAAGVTVSLIANGLPFVGSVAFALALVAAGCLFAAIATVASQVAASARGASALGGAAIAISFVMRAVGDVGDGRLSWFSPIGWAQGIRAFADERWWVLLLPLGATVGLIACAVTFQMRRDLGAGLLQLRPGRAAAAPHLSSPLALAARLHRPSIIGWAVGMGLMGFFYGIVADQAESILEDNPEMADFLAQLGGGSITDAFLATATLILALMATGFTVSAVLRMRSEETATRADVVLATANSRKRWLTSHLTVAFGGTVLVMVVTGGAMGVGLAVASGDGGKTLRLLGASMAMVPAMMVMAGVATALFAVAPKWSGLAWAWFAFALVVGMLQSLLDLPQWTRDLSPFQHVPAMPSAAFELVPVALLCAAAAVLIGAALLAIDHRDIAGA